MEEGRELGAAFQGGELSEGPLSYQRSPVSLSLSPSVRTAASSSSSSCLTSGIPRGR